MDTVIKSIGEVPFTQVSNKAIRDHELGAVALAIYTYIRSHDLNRYTIYKKNVKGRFSDLGRVAFDKGWKELIDTGWLKSERNQDESGRFNSWIHVLCVDNENISIDKATGKALRGQLTEVTDTDIRLTDSRQTSPHKNNKNKNNKNKNLKDHVASATFETLWSDLSKIWKDSKSPIGGKKPALAAMAKQSLTDQQKTTLVDAARQHALAVSKGKASGSKINLPNISTWINQKRFEQPASDFYTVTSAARNAQVNTNHNFDGRDWGLNNGQFA